MTKRPDNLPQTRLNINKRTIFQILIFRLEQFFIRTLNRFFPNIWQYKIHIKKIYRKLFQTHKKINSSTYVAANQTELYIFCSMKKEFILQWFIWDCMFSDFLCAIKSLNCTKKFCISTLNKSFRSWDFSQIWN